jgi:membrane protein implicated in regulation of membrane protease activity
MWATRKGADTKALLKMFVGAGVVALVLMGFLAAAAFGWLNKETAVNMALGTFLVGTVVLALMFGPALSGRRPPKNRPDRPPDTDRPLP